MPADSHGSLALITGASSGIGRELARVFAREGYSLILVARTAERLEELAAEFKVKYGTQSVVLPMDLSQTDAADQIWEKLSPAQRRLDVLVNCAGFGTFGKFWEGDTAQELGQLQVNIVTATHLIRLFLPEMVRRRSGHILNIGSVAGFQPGPYMPIYYASKAYLLSFSEAIAEQLKDTGVTMTLVAPGAVVTDFARRTGGGVSPERDGEYHGWVYNLVNMQADAVAEYSYKAMRQGRRLAIPGAVNRLVPLLSRLLPRKALTRIIGRSQEYMR